ncbi:unnamed protein product [marine sediment metagenome]|uniref:ParB/Sulfiredoxin domain-containing protein n=1 Tax=marine sediment metagenome TaxID=412755 RepID=X1MVV6_9ZZZZ
MNVKFNYQIEPFEINVDNIGDFVLLEHARKCRTSKVSQLKKLLLGGEHFDAPIVINQNSKKRVIDGQHRILAIKKAIEINPDITVEVLLAKYKDLDEAEERDVFNRWNIGTKQSTDDFIKMHKKNQSSSSSSKIEKSSCDGIVKPISLFGSIKTCM